VYSSLNNAFIPGLVKQMRYTKVWTDNVLYAITNNSIVRINTLDYNYSGTNDELFYTPMPEYKSQALSGLYQADVYISNGKLTATNLGVSKKYGIPLDAKFTVPDHVALNPNSGNLTGSYTPVIMIHFYDEVKGGFVYQPTLQFGDTKMQAVPAASGKAFDPANVPNKINMAAGISVEKDFLHLLKDKTTGKFALYVLDQGIDQYPSPIPPSPKALYDLSNAPEIGNATQFVLLNDQKVMYYATANKIYAVLYSSSPAIVEERYTAAAGEQITTLQVYQQAGYPVGFPYIATNNQQLVMSTWGTEGKVYLLPIKNPGLGTIDAANGKSFGGFGRITAIAPQK
jgi:hypothetical protein